MTDLTKAVRRMVRGPTPRGTSLVVTLTPAGIELRQARTRTTFLLPWSTAYVRAAWLAADATRRTRRRPTRNLLRGNNARD